LKLAFLTFLYPDYIASLYARRPGLAQSSYDSQVKVIADDSFGWNGAWEAALRPLGYEVTEIYSNVEPLQRAWVQEQQGEWARLNWVTETTFAQLKSYRPEILFIDDPRTFDHRWLARLRQDCPSLRLVIGFSGSPAYDVNNIRAYDAVLSCKKGYVDFFNQEGCQAFYLRNAFNPGVLADVTGSRNSASGLSFVGNVVRAAGYHLEREKLLEALVEAVPIDLYCPQGEMNPWHELLQTSARRGIYGLIKSLKFLGVKPDTLRNLPKIGRAVTWESMPLRQLNPRLAPRMKPAVYGLEMYRKLRQSAVALNSHIDAAGVEAGNCRLYEGTGIGSCLLTDWKTNLHEIFELDREVVAYRSAEECVEKARWLLEHPSEREAIAQAGQARTLRDHTFSARAGGLNAVVEELLKNLRGGYSATRTVGQSRSFVNAPGRSAGVN
jgi:spore maturation protein CgeB